jgi:hypothetical protein
MYHCLDDQMLQTVPAERHFVQIDNSIASNFAANKLPPQKINPFPRKKFRLVPHSASCPALPQLTQFPISDLQVP